MLYVISYSIYSVTIKNFALYVTYTLMVYYLLTQNNCFLHRPFSLSEYKYPEYVLL